MYLAVVDGVEQLYSVVADGSVPPVRLSAPGVPVTHFAVNKIGTVVAYRALVDDVPKLYSVPVSGGVSQVRSLDGQWMADAGHWAKETVYFTGSTVVDDTSVVYSSELLGRVPRFVVQPGTLAAQGAGAGVDLAARASGDGALRYQWEYCAAGDGAVYVPLADGPEVSGARRPSLALRNVGQRHAGLYRCRATSEHGSAYSRAVSLVVLGDSVPMDDEGEGVGEGATEGATEGEPEGTTEGAVEGELEGTGEGEGQAIRWHSADVNRDGALNLEEVLRVIQLYGAGGLHCAALPSATEDGYVPGAGEVEGCVPHDADHSPQDWKIGLVELLRVVQLYHVGAYHECIEEATEDGFCVGAAG